MENRGRREPQRINNSFRKRATLNELLCFQTLAHSFPRRPDRKSFFFCAFRTLFIVTEGVGGVSSPESPSVVSFHPVNILLNEVECGSWAPSSRKRSPLPNTI